MKFYQDPSFKQLQKQWYKKLTETGFKDIEIDEYGPLSDNCMKIYHDIHRGKKKDPTEYFLLAGRFLHENTWNQKKPHHYKVWELHSEGKLRREIAKLTGMDVSQIQYLLHAISQKMFKFYGVK